MQVSIIIVNYNTKHLTYNCIQSIYHFTSDIDVEIIVVDNDSSDQSIEFLESSFPNVMYIRSSTNIGFGLANNLGVRSAKGEFIFLLNSDTLLKENSIKKMHDFFVKNEKSMNLGVLGCKLVNKDLQINYTGDDFPTVISEITRMFVSIIPMRLLNKLSPRVYHFFDIVSIQNHENKFLFKLAFFEIDYVIGANMFLRKNVFDQFAGFSKDYFMYYEECDLQKRMVNAGLKNAILTGTEIIHFQGGSGLSQRKNSLRIISHQSRYQFLKKHDSKKFIFYQIFQHFYFVITIFNLKFSWKENVKYTKEMISFIHQ
jgi:GT2 family glycosyltransferase